MKNLLVLMSAFACLAPAIANAIFDAIGVRFKELPITQEKILWALKEKNRSVV